MGGVSLSSKGMFQIGGLAAMKLAQFFFHCLLRSYPETDAVCVQYPPPAIGNHTLCSHQASQRTHSEHCEGVCRLGGGKW